jgi:Ca2+-binding RTX toxin-like protein
METIDKLESERNEQRQDEQSPWHRDGTSNVGIGGDGDDEIGGGTGVDSLSGGNGADYLYGSDGADTIDGGDGDDYDGGLYGGAGNDVITGGNGDDYVDGDANNDLLSGDNGDDEIYGDAGTDTISGGDGDDFIYGGTGKDVLTGGAGSDTFAFDDGDSSSVAATGDQITDWSSSDLIAFGGETAIGGTAYVETVAADYATALGIATNAIAGGSINVVAIQIGADTVVFADTGDDDTAGTGVVLVGKGLADISAANVLYDVAV